MAVTVEDLNDWIDENSEDVFVDGPYHYSDEQYTEVIEEIIHRIEFKYGIKVTSETNESDDRFSAFWDTVYTDDINQDDIQNTTLIVFAEIINRDNIQEY